MTKQRELILEIINNSDKHLTAEEIFMLAKKKMPGMAMATVYNNLNYLCNAKIIRRLNINGGVVNYDKSIKWHEHSVCVSCGKITDFYIDGLANMIKEQLKTDVIDYELTARVLCEECRKLKTEED